MMRIPARHLVFVLLFLFSSRCTAQHSRWVDSTLATLSLEEKVGQLFVAELVPLFTNEDHQAYRYALAMIRDYHVGTFILGGGNVLDIPVVTNRLQKLSNVPLLINGDLEGGMNYMTPWRLSRGWTDRLPRYIAGGGTQFPSQMAIGATGDPRNAYEFGRITAIEARATGIRWSNSPVADVNSNAENPIINTRSYGEDPALVASMVEAYVRGAQSAGMITTLKHFPGHGDTHQDSHMELPSLPFGYGRLDSVELVPFRAGIAAGARAVMTSHLALPQIDPTGRPATLSLPIITGILRNRLGFDGIVVTDGMRMQGITDHFSSAEAAIEAVQAGVDCVLGIADIDSAFRGVVGAVRSGRISQQRIDISVRRILAAKEWAGLNEGCMVNIDSMFTTIGTAAFRATAQKISDASVTLLRNDGKVIPLRRSASVTLVTVSEDPFPQAGIELQQEIEPFVRSASLIRVSNETGSERFTEIRAEAQRRDILLVGIYLSVAAWRGDHRFAKPLEDFLDSLGRFPVPVITVAFGDPYVLGKLPSTQGVLTPFNGTILAEKSVARAVAGAIRIGGKSPVTVPGRYRRGEGIVLEIREKGD